MEYVPRLADPLISTYLSETPGSVLLVTGAPQVGKTRLIEHNLESAKAKRLSFSLKSHTHFRAQIDACSGFNQFRKLLENEYRFDPEKGTILFLDDIQESPGLATFIPRMHDAWRGSPIILCGSMLPDAFSPLFTEPSPFVTHITVRPYQFSEFLKAHQKGSLSRHVERGKTAIFEDRHSRLLEWLERFLEVGGLPEVVDWASHGEDFCFHLDQIISEIEVQADTFADHIGKFAINDALRTLSEQPEKDISPEFLSILKRWDLVLGFHPSSVAHCVFDLGIARQFSLVEPPSFWDAESDDSEALNALGSAIKHQTGLALHYQNASLSSIEGVTADFIIETNGMTVPIMCTPLFSLDSASADMGFSMIDAAKSDMGVIVCMTPFESIERDGKRLLIVPLYLIEALLTIASSPV